MDDYIKASGCCSSRIGHIIHYHRGLVDQAPLMRGDSFFLIDQFFRRGGILHSVASRTVLLQYDGGFMGDIAKYQRTP